jgi:hypothetical protein
VWHPWTRNLILFTPGPKVILFAKEMVLLEMKIIFADNIFIVRKKGPGSLILRDGFIVHLNYFVIIMKILKLLKLQTCMIGCREMLHHFRHM